MKHLKPPVDPVQPRLFDDEATAWWAVKLAPNALRRLEEGWQGIFRRSLLKLMPAEQLSRHFSEDRGRPSKELYSMAGLLLIAEFKNLTGEETAEAYTFDTSIQYALNLPSDRQYLSARSVDNYRRLFRQDELAQEVFGRVTAQLVEELRLDIRRQRLDSTHVHSRMAQLGRQQLLAVGLKRFLVQLRKHHPEEYEALPEALRERYERSETRLFGQGTKNPLPREEAIAQLGTDMVHLVSGYNEHKSISQMKSYQALARLLVEHFHSVQEEPQAGEGTPFDGSGGEVKLRAKSRDAKGGSTRTLQNPSDPDAGYNGKKGPGYQAQIAQSLPPRDEEGRREGPGLITALAAQSAAVRDNEALPEVLDQLQEGGRLPEELSMDSIYGSDANVQEGARRGVEIISPVGGAKPSKGGQSKHQSGRAERALKARLQQRREAEETPEWKKKYAPRSGIEGLNRALDMVSSFKQLRVRGLAAVSMALNLKAAGWNLLAAAQIKRKREKPTRCPDLMLSELVRWLYQGLQHSVATPFAALDRRFATNG